MGNLQVGKGHALFINDSLYAVCSVQIIDSINKQHRWQSNIFKLPFIDTFSDIWLLFQISSSLLIYIIEKVPNVKNTPNFPKSKSSTICSNPHSSFLVKKADELVREESTSKSKDSNTLTLVLLRLIPRISSWAYHLVRTHMLSQSQKIPQTCAISLHLRFDSTLLMAPVTLPLSSIVKTVQSHGA